MSLLARYKWVRYILALLLFVWDFRFVTQFLVTKYYGSEASMNPDAWEYVIGTWLLITIGQMIAVYYLTKYGGYMGKKLLHLVSPSVQVPRIRKEVRPWVNVFGPLLLMWGFLSVAYDWYLQVQWTDLVTGGGTAGVLGLIWDYFARPLLLTLGQEPLLFLDWELFEEASEETISFEEEPDLQEESDTGTDQSNKPFWGGFRGKNKAKIEGGVLFSPRGRTLDLPRK